MTNSIPIMLSVIVPVYNVEKYLRKCVDSILAQDIDDMEVILVDDGSLDNSGAICNEYAEKDARVKAIHIENGGCSAARNAGLDTTRGKYLAFVDSDDYLLPNTYRPNLDYLESHPKVDCLQFPTICDERIVFTKKYKVIQNEMVFVGNDVFLNWWSAKLINHFVWNKLYKREVFSNLRFKDGVFIEDSMIVPELAKKCKMVFISMEGGYFYRYNDSSLLNSGWNKKKYTDFFMSKYMMWEQINNLDFMNAAKIKSYLVTIIQLAICSQKGYLNYKDYDEFLDAIPSICLLPKSRELGMKGWAAFTAIKIIGTRGFVKLFKRFKLEELVALLN